jgi:hypothetical protein
MRLLSLIGVFVVAAAVVLIAVVATVRSLATVWGYDEWRYWRVWLTFLAMAPAAESLTRGVGAAARWTVRRMRLLPPRLPAGKHAELISGRDSQ